MDVVLMQNLEAANKFENFFGGGLLVKAKIIVFVIMLIVQNKQVYLHGSICTVYN